MDADKVEAHRQALRQAEKDKWLGAKAPTASINNPKWFVHTGTKQRPTQERRALHDRILNDWKNQVPNPGKDKIAIMTAGPPGAGKTSARESVQERLSPEGWRVIDPDEFKDNLLRQALDDGTFQDLVPESVRESGERFYPRELAPLVHDESVRLAEQAQAQAIAAGENVVIDGTLAGRDKPDRIAQSLTEAGYTIHVVDVETTADVSRERVMGRWQEPYIEAEEKAERGEDVSKELGGRWVNSEVVDFMFSKEDSPYSICADNAEALIHKHPAVQEVDRYFTPNAQSGAERVESWQRDENGKVTHRTYDNPQKQEQGQQKEQGKEQGRDQSREVRSVAGQSSIEALRNKVGGREAAAEPRTPGAARTNSVPSQAQAQNQTRAVPAKAPQRDDKRREDRTRGQER
ncbi:zeta toxin family protein [Streptomyces griseocarneus]|uniref:zeta toxin family protein n=1 Tax=Streptomyces griseocarneus TaxID=51201 RepID=UPI00167D80D8|nr:zeta toxin family protein [Streptomyces griseocarneus]MBZ6478023.1 zeta toxin family protein [Streptomyces griseocarneus]GHG64207.1 hypothetical protein GCM10018779_33970 [Streptomyces griseocarneus]